MAKNKTIHEMRMAWSNELDNINSKYEKLFKRCKSPLNVKLFELKQEREINKLLCLIYSLAYLDSKSIS